MQGVSVRSVTLLLVVAMAEVTWGLHPALSRWTRQAIHCQAGDDACKMCSTSCNTVEVSRLPECCEAYNACCDQYFQACKKCSSVASKDQYFPEYCCASFTDCCDLITTFNAPIKAPEPVRKEVKSELKVPTVAAPKPTTFPGSSAPVALASPAASPFPTRAQPAPQPPLASQPTGFSSQFPPVGASTGQLGSTVVGSRRQRVQGGQRSQPARRPPQQASNGRRRGRVTSRGRVIQ